jgi:hypothetical protein
MNRRRWDKTRGQMDRGKQLAGMQDLSGVLLAKANGAVRKSMRCKFLEEAL